MDENEAKKLEGRKIISFNMDRWIDDKNNVCKSYVVEVVEKVGKDWVVTRGNNLNLTKLKNPVQEIGVVLTEEGEPGQPINDSQWLQLQGHKKISKCRRDLKKCKVSPQKRPKKAIKVTKFVGSHDNLSLST